MRNNLKAAIVTSLTQRVPMMTLRPLLHGRVTIFLLHRLSNTRTAKDSVTTDTIFATLALLRRAGATFISLEDLFDQLESGHEPCPGSVAFTIDDGFQDQANIAEAILNGGAKPTIFLISGFIDGANWPWDDQLSFCISNARTGRLRIETLAIDMDISSPQQKKYTSVALQNLIKSMPWTQAANTLEAIYECVGCHPPRTPPPQYAPMTWDQIRGLERVGVKFAPHSVTHRITSRLTETEVQDEISESWKRLRSELSDPLQVYAWPTGRNSDFSERNAITAKALGMRGAVAVNNNYADLTKLSQDQMRLFSLSRFALSGDISDNLQYGTAIERLKQLIRFQF